MKINKSGILGLYIFAVSPVFCLPLVFFQLRRRVDAGICLLVGGVFGVLSYKYIPHFSDDKARYLERYELFSGFSMDDLYSYFLKTIRPDYLFDLMNFAFAKLGLGADSFFFLVSFFTVSSYLYFVRAVFKSVNPGAAYTNFALFLVVLSLSLPNVFSGVRFLFAGGFFVWFFYYVFFNRRLLFALAFLSVSVMLHFSYIYLAFAVLLAFIFPGLAFARVLLIVSFAFFLVPRDVVIWLLQLFSFSAGQQSKVELYASMQLDVTNSWVILEHIRNAWFYFACVFLLFYRPLDGDKVFVPVVVIAAFVNFVFPISVAYSRYAVFLKVLFTAFLLLESFSDKRKKAVLFMFMLFFILGYLADLIVLRENLLQSYSFFEIATLASILSTGASESTFLY